MNFIRKIVTQSSKGDDKVFYDAMRNLLKFKPYHGVNYNSSFDKVSNRKVGQLKGLGMVFTNQKRF